MKILNLKVRNVKQIEAIDITPDSNTITLSGKNGAGKSSTLDSIAMALAGSKMIPENPVRNGENEASIEIDLGEYFVTRHWTSPDKSYLSVKTKDGARISNGQTVLNKIVGNLTFDPLEFANMDASSRLGVLKTLTGLSFLDLDKEYKQKYDERTLMNRDANNLKARLSEFDGLAENPVDMNLDLDAIKKDREAAILVNDEISGIKDSIGKSKGLLDHYNQQIGFAENFIKELEGKIKVQREHIDRSRNEIVKVTKATNILKESLEHKKEIDLKQFDEQMEQYYEYKRFQDKITARNKLRNELYATNGAIDIIGHRLCEINQEKIDRVKATKMPIEGLDLGTKDVQFKGIPFKNLSTSEQIRVSMSIAMSMNPTLRIAMIKEGSLLDQDAMNEVKNMANEKDYQVWIECVANGPSADCIYIHEGRVQ